MMNIGPVQCDDFHTAAPMGARDDLAMPTHQLVTVPARFKHRGTHRASADRLLFGPHLLRVDSLYRLIRAEQQAGEVTADMFKARVPIKNVSIRLQPCSHQEGNTG